MPAAGTAPDVFWTHAYVSPNLAKLGLLGDINSYIKRDKDFKVQQLLRGAVQGLRGDGKQFGVPREATTTVVIINKELFQKRASPCRPPTGPRDDFLRAAQQMTRGDGSAKTWGAGGFVGPGSARLLRPDQGLAGGGRHRRQDAHQVHPAPDPGGGADAVDGGSGHPPPGVTPTATTSPGRPRTCGTRGASACSSRSASTPTSTRPSSTGTSSPAAGQDPGHPHRLGRPQHDRGEQEQGRRLGRC